MTKALRKNLKNRKGFTLIELIVVIAIIAILAAVLIPRFTGFTENANKKAVLSDARNILVALEAMAAEGEFPTVDQAAKVNDYVGKDIITPTPATPLSDGQSSLTGVTDDIDFVYTKMIGTATYTATCTDSVIEVAVS